VYIDLYSVVRHYVYIHIHIRIAYKLTAPPVTVLPLPCHHPLDTVVAPDVAYAPKDVEHAVGRRREAHAVARGGAGARRGQRRPGVGHRAEAVHVVEEIWGRWCMCVCGGGCMCVDLAQYVLPSVTLPLTPPPLAIFILHSFLLSSSRLYTIYVYMPYIGAGGRVFPGPQDAHTRPGV
jgi:hypothetical protein